MKLLNAQTQLQRKQATKIKSEMKDIVSGHEVFELALLNVRNLLDNGGLNAEMMLISGAPGTGKTSFCKKIADLITEENNALPNPSKKPVILIESPISPSAGGLAYQILREIGDPVIKKARLEALAEKVQNYLKKLDVKLIIIDEAHNFAPSSGGDKAKLSTNFLKTLSNISKVPILLVGTNKAKEFYLNEDEICARTTFQVQFSNIPYGKTDEEKTQFAVLVDKYAKCFNQLGTQLTFVITNNDGKKVLKNTSLLDKIYIATAGNLRSLRNLFYQLTDVVIEHPSSEAITENTFFDCWLPSMNKFLDFNPFYSSKVENIDELIKKCGV